MNLVQHRTRGTKLGVNIDHVATLRQLRGTPYPDLIAAAQSVERAGAHQITVHLREDRRHIQDQDVKDLKKNLQIPLNLEMSVADEIVRFACKNRPQWACLVPEKRKELTTEGGLNVQKQKRRVAQAIERLKKSGIKVSLFIEPKISVAQWSRELGADAVELHTGRYCLETQKSSQINKAKMNNELRRIRETAIAAKKIGLQAHAGHGFDFQNIIPVAQFKDDDGMPLIDEFNIGHSIVCRAAFVGLDAAVREMMTILSPPRSQL